MADFVKVAGASVLRERGHACATAGGKTIGVFFVDGKFFAIDSKCTHIGGPLCESRAEGGVATCPWHGSQFNISDGAVVHGPAGKPVKTYPVRVKGDDVEVQV